MRVIYWYRSQLGKSDCQKKQFHNEIACEWNLQNPGEIILRLDTLTDMLKMRAKCN